MPATFAARERDGRAQMYVSGGVPFFPQKRSEATTTIAKQTNVESKPTWNHITAIYLLNSTEYENKLAQGGGREAMNLAEKS